MEHHHAALAPKIGEVVRAPMAFLSQSRCWPHCRQYAGARDRFEVCPNRHGRCVNDFIFTGQWIKSDDVSATSLALKNVRLSWTTEDGIVALFLFRNIPDPKLMGVL
jgi:hypothetical protein